MATALAVRRPRESRADRHTREMEETAAKLQRLTGGMLSISYHPGTFFSDDHGVKGYLVSGHADPFCNADPEWDNVQIDARKGKLRKQLMKELRRISKTFRDIARRVKRGTP